MDFSSIATLIATGVFMINIVLAGVIIFVERKDIGSTWAWLLVIFFLPLLGFFIYITFGRRLKRKNLNQILLEESRYLQWAVNKQLENLNDHELIPPNLMEKYSDSIRMNLKSANALLTTNNDIEIFTDGNDKFDALFEDIRNAKKEINIEYYIYQRDALGRKMREELTKKAKEGVKVRVLYDGFGSRKISPRFFKELISYGGEVGVFFPSFFKLINFRINNRNHRKLCIIDGHIAYIGGFNIGDEYLGLKKKFGYWRDTHLRMRGDAVTHIQGRFILDWNQATKKRTTTITEHFNFPTESVENEAAVQIIAGGPSSRYQHLKNMYIKLISSAEKELLIQTPYFIPDASFMDACKLALLSGVNIKIMIPDKPDHPFVYWATWAYVGELLNYGAQVYLYENGFLHAKTLVVDEEVATVGTTNIDNRSFQLNFEINATIYDEKMAKDLKELYIEDLQECTELTLERYKNRSMIIKFKESISRLLSPIL